MRANGMRRKTPAPQPAAPAPGSQLRLAKAQIGAAPQCG